MKRLLSMALALCVLVGGSATARAQAAALRVLSGSREMAQAYQLAHPDCAVQLREVDYSRSARGNLAELLAAGEWDIAFLSTADFSLPALVDAGLAMPLDPSAELCTAADNLYPSLRAAVTVRGTLAAYPAGYVSSLVMGLSLMGEDLAPGSALAQRAAAHLQALGFTRGDRPQTFAQLCALGERYMQKPADARRGTTFITLEGSSATFVLSLLLDLYTTQYLYTGRCATFDTEPFRTALSQFQSLAAALASDPKNTYDADGYCWPLVQDCSQTLVNDSTFLRLGDAQGIPASLGMAIINPKSTRTEAAAAYLLFADAQSACLTAPAFYQRIDYAALVRQGYDQDIAAQRVQQEVPSVIDRLIALRDAGDPSHYAYSLAEIELYREEVAPRLLFPQTQDLDTQSAMQQYLLGKLNTDGFIAALNAALAP